jgi:hypothetical protein
MAGMELANPRKPISYPRARMKKLKNSMTNATAIPSRSTARINSRAFLWKEANGWKKRPPKEGLRVISQRAGMHEYLADFFDRRMGSFEQHPLHADAIGAVDVFLDIVEKHRLAGRYSQP